jgi:hypothetical protein
MAKLSELILRTSEITGIPEATVREVSRRLREGNLIQTGKGGRYGGADMRPKDAASLLTALLIVRGLAAPFTNIASTTRSYLRDLTAHRPRGDRMVWCRWDRRTALPQLCRLKSGHTFEDALTALIISFSNGDFEREMVKWNGVRFGVEVVGFIPGALPVPDPAAIIYLTTDELGELGLIYIRHRSAELIHKIAPKNWSEIPGPPNFDLTVKAEVGDPTLKSIGILLRNTEPSHE